MNRSWLNCLKLRIGDGGGGWHLSRGGKLYGMCEECLLVCWVTAMREGLVGDEAGV